MIAPAKVPEVNWLLLSPKSTQLDFIFSYDKIKSPLSWCDVLSDNENCHHIAQIVDLHILFKGPVGSVCISNRKLDLPYTQTLVLTLEYSMI